MVVALLRLKTAFLLLSLSSASALAQQGALVHGEVLIKFMDHATEIDRKEVESQHGLVLVKHHASIDIYHYRSEASDVWTLIANVRSSPHVYFAEPNYVRERQSAPNDEFYKFQWYLPKIGWENARAAFTGTAPVTVAVIDSGVTKLHKHLDGYRVATGEWDFVQNDSDASDESGHGTMVAGIITGATGDGKSVAGISSTARILPLRVFDNAGFIADGASVDVSVLVEALDRARTQGARIINLSLGGPLYSFSERLALSACDNAGILLVCAAGNGNSQGIGVNNDVFPTYPASYDLLGIISVAATDEENKLTQFSNFGLASVDIAAPGQFIVGCDVPRRTLYEWNFAMGWQGWTEFVQRGNGWVWDYFLGRRSLVTSGPPPYYAAAYAARSSMMLISPKIDLRNQVGARLEIDVIGRLGLDDYLSFSTQRSDEAEDSWGGVLLYPGWAYETVQRDISRLDGTIGELNIALIADLSGWGTHSSGTLGLDHASVSVLDRGTVATEAVWYADGTSFAAPIVSGVAAMMMSQSPQLTHHQVRQKLLAFAKPAPDLYGKIYSRGVVDAELALASAKIISPPPLFLPPIIDSETSAKGQVGVAFSYQISASNSPTSFNASGLPAGLSINTATGVISGTPTTDGFFVVNLSAANQAGTRTRLISLSIAAAPAPPKLPPIISSPTTAGGQVGVAFSYQVTASNSPISFNTIGALPSGLSINRSTGLISGSPARAGRFFVAIAAANLSGSDSKVLDLAIAEAPTPLPKPTATPALDRTAPTLRVTAPKGNSVATKAARFALRGTAGDNVTPMRMQFRVRPPGSKRYGRWATVNLAKGNAKTKSWSRVVSLNKKGNWLVQIRVLDGRNNASAARVITIRRR